VRATRGKKVAVEAVEVPKNNAITFTDFKNEAHVSRARTAREKGGCRAEGVEVLPKIL